MVKTWSLPDYKQELLTGGLVLAHLKAALSSDKVDEIRTIDRIVMQIKSASPDNAGALQDTVQAILGDLDQLSGAVTEIHGASDYIESARENLVRASKRF